MSKALDNADRVVAGLLPSDRWRLLRSLHRYCWICGRVGTKDHPHGMYWECAHCGVRWNRQNWPNVWEAVLQKSVPPDMPPANPLR